MDPLQTLYKDQRDVVLFHSDDRNSIARAEQILVLLVTLLFDLPFSGTQSTEALIASLKTFMHWSTDGGVGTLNLECARYKGNQTLKGRELEQRIEQIQEFISTICGFTLSSESKALARRLAFCSVKDRTQSRSMPRIIADLEAQIKDLLSVGSYKSCKELPPLEGQGLSVCEFFSGIGGMRLGLPQSVAGRPIYRVHAYDQASVPNAVYRHNFERKDINNMPGLDNVRISLLKDTVVQALGPSALDNEADIWTMSPPCQPYTTTRGAYRRDHLDQRSRGLCHMIHVLLSMTRPPRWIFLENVKGFIGSRMHSLWRQTLQSCGYEIEEFLLSPDSTAGIPNSRARYYCLATHKDEMNRTGRVPASKECSNTCQLLGSMLAEMTDEVGVDKKTSLEEDEEDGADDRSLHSDASSEVDNAESFEQNNTLTLPPDGRSGQQPFAGIATKIPGEIRY